MPGITYMVFGYLFQSQNTKIKNIFVTFFSNNLDFYIRFKASHTLSEVRYCKCTVQEDINLR